MLLTHGWPGSVVEFLAVIPHLTDEFHLVVPSLPGYGFSEPTRTRGWDVPRVARAFMELMARLGYDALRRAGRRLGRPSHDAHRRARSRALPRHPREHADRRPARGKARAHRRRARPISPRSHSSARRSRATRRSSRPSRRPSASRSTTRPPGCSRGSSRSSARGATATATPRTRSPAISCITNVMTYWVTQTITSSMRLYWENRHSAESPQFVGVPTGVARYPKELLRFPRSWVERRYNVTHWADMPRGGHFAGDGATGVVRRRPPDLLPHRALTVAGRPVFVSDCVARI